LSGFIFTQTALPEDQIFEREMAQVGHRYIPGEIIVKFKTGVREDAIANINSRHGASVFYRNRSRFAGFRRLRVPRRRKATEMLERYRKEPNVEYAELNYIAYTCWAPNDTYYPYQWHLDNPDYGGIRMEDAWDFLIDQGLPPGGSPDVIVAVVDTGVAYEDYSSGRRGYYLAPDLAATNFVQGYDFVAGDSHANDDHGHGTHVTGTIAQSTDNGLGVAGVAFNCSIMPVKVLNRYGSGTYADVADGIIFATDNGAHVINLSLGGSSPSTTLRNACAYAYQNGVTIVCAAGNNGEDRLRYPAAYNDYCIAVGATRYDETLSYYSNHGNGLDLVAPGGDLHAYQSDDEYADGVLQQTFSYSTSNFGYWFYQGTSMATPHVSGVAALLISAGVAFEPNEVRVALQSTAEDLGPEGWDETYGWGLVDAFAALQWTSEPGVPVLAAIEVSPNSVTLDEGQTQQFTAAGKDQYGDPIDAGPITWDSNDEAVGTIDSGGLFTAVGGGTTTVSATGGTVVGTTSVTVEEVPVLTTIEVSPNSVTLDEGQTQQFTAAGKDQYGDPIDAGPITWDSNDEAVGTIDSGGLFTAIAAGTTTVSATGGTVVGTANVTVQEVPVLTTIEVSPNSVTLDEGQTQQFSAAGKDQFGDPIATGPIVWDSNDVAVGTINSGGLFTAIAAGTATVSATGGTVVGTANVTVQEVPVLTTIEVSPNSVTLDEGQTQQFTAAGKDQFGDPIATGPIVWERNCCWDCKCDCAGSAGPYHH
jgi:serine protease